VRRLEAIVEELDDRTFTMLREASAGGGGRPAAERRLTSARRAIEKAIQQLHAADGTAAADDGDG